MKKRRWLLPDWAYVPIAIFNIVMIFYMIIVGCVLIYVGRKQVSDYPDSVWYCEETNMRATVIAPEDDVDYIAIVDLDDGEKYTVDMPWPTICGKYLFQYQPAAGKIKRNNPDGSRAHGRRFCRSRW